jgi:hypothetical protein
MTAQEYRLEFWELRANGRYRGDVVGDRWRRATKRPLDETKALHDYRALRDLERSTGEVRAVRLYRRDVEPWEDVSPDPPSDDVRSGPPSPAPPPVEPPEATDPK